MVSNNEWLMLRTIALALSIAAAMLVRPFAAERPAEERLSFQTSGPWSPRTNLNAAVAMVYGIGPRMPANIETWKQRGYTIHVMTGVALGPVSGLSQRTVRRTEPLGSGANGGRRQTDSA